MQVRMQRKIPAGCQPQKSYMRKIIFLVSAVFVLAACEKEDENEIKGTVIEKKGCYPDSYLVEITDAGNMQKSFACAGSTPIVSDYNCTNAVFIHLPLDLGIAGKKIRFVFAGEEVSCLSSTGAPSHIIVKSVKAD